MDGNGKHQGGGVSMMEKKGEVVVGIPNVGGESNDFEHDHDHGLKLFESMPQGENELASKSPPFDCASPEIRFTPSPNKPPRYPTTNANLTKRKSFVRSVYSKPKSRFGEQPYHVDGTIVEENVLQEQLAVSSSYKNSFNKGSYSSNYKSESINRSVSIASFLTTRTSWRASPSHAGEDPDEIIYKKVEFSKGKHKRLTTRTSIELFVFAMIAGNMLASLTVEELRRIHMWSLRLWRWWMLAMVTFCGMLVTKWFMHIVVFVIEMNFLLRKKVLYFVHGMKKCVQVFIWIGLVLLTWVLFIKHEVPRSKLAEKILDGVTWTLVSLLIGAFLWVVKTLLLKILASNFHVKSFFDRIQESIFHQYVLQTLSGPPLLDEDEKIGRSQRLSHFSFRSITNKGDTKKEVIDMAKLHSMKQEKVSSWTMKILVDSVMNSKLSTISSSLDETFYDVENKQTDKEITNEMEATAAAYHVFRNVAASPSCTDIDENELRRFMIKEEVPWVFPLLAQAETGLITRKSLTDWVLKVYQERRALAHALSDTKTAVKQLNKLVTVVVVLVTILVWLLLMEIANSKVLLFIASQLVLASFMFANTCKNIFEAIIFVFIMHPFDVGDRCVVDGVELVVEEMNLLTTVFLKLSNEKLYYPNSVLAVKPISNYYRSPDMIDSLEFWIDFKTPAEKIGALNEKIKWYVERTPQYWHANFDLFVREIENVNRIKMGLYVIHTMNFQDVGAKLRRKSELVMEVKRIFEELKIIYNLLPQAVHLRHTEPDTS
ncbi:mechanosensitive ion channel protein 10-like [Vicia villosa]|uniref:mechanosensitive ion channel protein 10-like n=1 Tax=Vicia villosa TaxID=3911 RepID=UPI00273ABA21|nr:mechanosensitive ion channel protein 10-like [Vicia villosa]